MTPSPSQTSAPNTAVMMVYHHNGQEKCHTKKCSFIFWVFWIMKMSRKPPPTREVIAPPLSPARLVVALGSCFAIMTPILNLWPRNNAPRDQPSMSHMAVCETQKNPASVPVREKPRVKAWGSKHPAFGGTL
jgi:hypothetical protein